MQRHTRNLREVKKLKDIVGVVFGVDVDAKSRRMPHPSARAVFSKVLTLKGYTLTEVGSMIDKNHATIIHYIRGLEAEVKTNQQLRIKYQEVQDMFVTDTDPIHSLSSFELKKEVISLRKQNKKLYLEKESLISIVEKSKEDDKIYRETFELIKRRIGRKEIDKLKNHLTRYFNGVHK
jgi:hypothetical protein